MAKIILEVFYYFFKNFVLIFLSPLFSGIDWLLEQIGLDTYLSLFYNILTNYIEPFCGFFFEFLGPHTIEVLILEFTATIAFYALSMSITWILKALNFIKKLPLA